MYIFFSTVALYRLRSAVLSQDISTGKSTRFGFCRIVFFTLFGNVLVVNMKALNLSRKKLEK